MYLADSNVLLDVLTRDPTFFAWSRDALADALIAGPVAINPLIYAELSIAYRDVADLDRALARLRIGRRDLPWEAAPLAGRAFLKYRRKGGSRSSPLPDFYIGAHAEVAGLTLLTRDARRYRTYFPRVILVAPRKR